MKTLCLVLAASLAALGCGHNSSFTDTTPTQVHTDKTDVGLWSTTGDTKTEVIRSDWEACLDKNRGYPDSETECTYWIQAGRPGQMPRYIYGMGWNPGYGGYYGQRYITPGTLVYGR